MRISGGNHVPPCGGGRERERVAVGGLLGLQIEGCRCRLGRCCCKRSEASKVHSPCLPYYAAAMSQDPAVRQSAAEFPRRSSRITDWIREQLDVIQYKTASCSIFVSTVTTRRKRRHGLQCVCVCVCVCVCACV